MYVLGKEKQTNANKLSRSDSLEVTQHVIELGLCPDDPAKFAGRPETSKCGELMLMFRICWLVAIMTCNI